MRGDAAADRCDHRHRKRIEDPIRQGGEKRNLIDEAQRGKARLRDQGTDSLAAGDLRFHPRIRKPTESGERFELEELGILETQSRRSRPDTLRNAGACALPPTRLTLWPASTAGRWLAANSPELRTSCPSV